jgi:UDP-N-acetylglucosamine--N-acetylmuramyl-(pentapeptide) pyrophosphoryl-undecaprenol N-acetylglucosamine transferase
MKILFTGGGTGGHILPIISIIREIRRIYPKNLDFYYIGPKDEFANISLSHEEVIVKNIVSGKIRRYFDFQNIIDILFKIPFGIIQSFFLLLVINPDLVFSKGGSGSVAVTFSAMILRIPIFVHESDTVPGLSNQTASKWAKKVFTSFPQTEYFNQEKIILTGNPIRKEITGGDKKEAADIFGLTLSKPILLVMGGSQGAEFINDFILLILNDLLKDYEIIHITGPNNVKEMKAEAKVVESEELAKYYHPIGFLDENKLRHAYAASDLIISRSGSGSIFEIAANGKASILIPLPSAAADHQSKNAYSYAQTGSAMVIEQENLTPNFFIENLQLLFLHPEKLKTMSEASLRFAKPLAARSVAREILEFLMLE